MNAYAEFLNRKQVKAPTLGRECTPDEVNPTLHHWQRELVAWAVRTGRAAMWEDTGLGKTFQQIEWARLSGDNQLIIAPLAVCQQTVREAAKLGIEARYVRSSDEVTGNGMWVTNYERVQAFQPELFDAVVLDESSCLKQSDGKTRTMLIEWAAGIPNRLACSATPAPNDPEELTNQAEWLGRMSRTHMLAAYFIHDQDGWRIKGHARAPMIRWMAQWAVALTKPSDVGGDDTGYILPGLEVVPEIVASNIETEGQLFATDIGGVTGRAKLRRSTLNARVDRAVSLVYDCAASQQSGLYEGVLRRQQEQMEADAGAACGTESEASGTVCERQGISRPDQSTSSTISKASSATAARMGLRSAQGRRGADDRCGVLDLPRESTCGLTSTDAYRPRPSDGHGPWCSLSELQSSAGAHGRRSDSSDGDVRLPHACNDQWVLWCGLNAEQDALAKAFDGDCGSIDGRTPLEDRILIADAWRRGEFRILVVKPGMYSYGMNWQHCSRMAFVGLGDSYESYYQSIRRCYRYGQTEVVRAHVIVSELESQIAANVARKEKQANQITTELVAEMRRFRGMHSTIETASGPLT